MSGFAGYAALWDRVDRAGDVFRPGAFGAAREVPLLRGHGGEAVGRVQVAEDARGLRVTGAAEGVRAGDGLSVGYRAVRVRQGAWRELLAVELVEVSLVAQPMQPLARIDSVDRGSAGPVRHRMAGRWARSLPPFSFEQGRRA